MALWLVMATWSDDEAELTQQWEVNVATEDEAVREVVMLLPSRPQHIEVKLLSEHPAPDLGPGQARKLRRGLAAVSGSGPGGTLNSEQSMNGSQCKVGPTTRVR